MQQGDNGQSLVLGGRDAEGNCLFNEVSRMCLKASYDLNLIDPKINLRCDANTPLEIYKLGAELTKRGLGFPQYDNDDVVIPGLMKLGYSSEDAHNYVVAACWEFIIPKNGMEIPNIDALSFAEIVSDAVNSLGDYSTYDEFYAYIVSKINDECKRITSAHDNLYIAPAPFLSTFMGGTIEKAKDISEGGISNNYGVHGTGLSTAADSLAAIKKFYFEEKSVSLEELMDALHNNFVGHEALQDRLRNEAPKMGLDNEEADAIGTALLDSFAEGLKGYRNERGGIWRAGTGTAMYYIFHAKDLPATPDGRNAGEVLPANFTPSMFLKQNGPVSVMRSFAKPNLENVINGGPLTIELDDSIFRNEETVEKLAMLIRSYIRLGGHQLQLNTLDRPGVVDWIKPADSETLKKFITVLEKILPVEAVGRFRYRSAALREDITPDEMDPQIIALTSRRPATAEDLALALNTDLEKVRDRAEALVKAGILSAEKLERGVFYCARSFEFYGNCGSKIFFC